MSQITVTTDGAALLERIRQGSDMPLVMWYGTLPKELDLSGLDLVEPDTPTEEERLAVLDEYVELISSLGKANGFSTAWISHPISQKNDLEAYPLFDQMIDYARFVRVWSEFGARRGLAIVAHQEALLAHIRSFAAAAGVRCETPGWKPRRSGAFAGLRGAWAAWRKEIKYARRMGARAREASRFLGKIDRTRTYSLLSSAFTSRSPGEIESGRDVFLGCLPSYLKEQGRSLLYYGSPPDKDGLFEDVLQRLERIDSFPILPSFALIRRLDRWATILFSLTLNRQIHIPASVTFDQTEVVPVLRNYMKQKPAREGARTNYVHYLANRRLLRSVRISEVFTRFENKPGDQLFARVVEEENPSIVIKAFQHAQVAQNSSRLFLGKDEAASLPLPHFVMTLGAYTRDYLVEKKSYPPSRVRVACALRHDRLPKPSPERPRHRRVLVCLWNLRRSVELLDFLMQVDWSKSGTQVLVRPHPTHPIRSVEKALGTSVQDVMKISDATFAEDLARTDAAIYSGTTACLDALAGGLPVINVEFDDYLSPDPLFQFDAFKWTVDRPSEVGDVLARIEGLSDTEFMARRGEAQRFVNEYFYPVTEENLRVFLE